MKIPVGLSLLVAACLVSASPALAQTCGDYVRDAGEQCDDGNARNLDGCDGACKFEQTHRVNNLILQRTTDATCAANVFGGAFTGNPAGNIGYNNTQAGLAASVTAGATNIIYHALGLDDETGVVDPSFELGVMSGSPIGLPNPSYNGNNDLDWWYAADKTLIDPGTREPINRLAASLAGNVLTAGPGRATVKLILSGSPAAFVLSSLTVGVTTGAATTPAASTGLPPGHLAVEHLDPALQSFATAGTVGAPGTICGNISALSLAQTQVPPALRGAACNAGYTAANSLLDLYVNGCTLGFVILTPTQPDQTDPNPDAPSAGNGPPYVLSIDPVTKIVNTCRDNLNAVVDLTTCLRDAAYSSHFKFTSDRVILHDNLLFEDSFGSGDFSAWTAVSTAGGDLVVDPSASMAGTPAQGMLGTIDDTTGRWVQDGLPDNENRLRARFYVDPSAFDPGEASLQRRTRLLIGFEEDPLRRVFAIVLRRLAGQYAIRGRATLDDDTRADTPFVDITAAPHFIEIDWLRSSGPDANDGNFVLSIDGTVQSTLTALDNSVSSIDFARLGALSLKSAANGTLKWDHYQANRMGAVGP